MIPQPILRDATADDAAAICDIYNPYVTGTTISFEEEPVSPADMAHRIGHTLSLGLPWLVAELNGRIVGYAYASRWRARAAYRFAAESSVYLRQDTTGHGLGKCLYRALLARLAAMDIHTVIGGVAQPNAPSNGLHQAMGFRQVACFAQVGRKFDRWLDVAYWQRELGPDYLETT